VEDEQKEALIEAIESRPPEKQQPVHVLNAIDEFGLDFEDAYQHGTAKTRDLALVSFDDDFDDTDLDRLTPQDVLDERA
jgi:predicted nucleic acid-binding protein